MGHTFTTTNELRFEARRRLTSLSCFASNKVLDDSKGIPLRRDTTISVNYREERERDSHEKKEHPNLKV